MLVQMFFLVKNREKKLKLVGCPKRWEKCERESFSSFLFFFNFSVFLFLSRALSVRVLIIQFFFLAYVAAVSDTKSSEIISFLFHCFSFFFSFILTTSYEY